MQIRLKIFILSLLVMISGNMIIAQDSTLQFNTPIQGTVENGSTDTWTFTARDGEVLSFSVMQTSGNLDPAISIENQNGETIITNDDYNYPENRDALLESVTMPRTGTYTLSVSGTNETSGEYILNMLPGYAETAFVESFSDSNDWTFLSENPAPNLTVEDGTLNLQLEGIDQVAYTASSAVSLLRNFFIRANIQEIAGRNGWMTGLILRYQNDERYYSFTVNSQGYWRFTKQENGESTTLRDWTSHPAIVAGESTFSLSALANANSFDFFYNGQFIGTVIDESEEWYDSGSVGFEVGTANALSSTASLTADNMIITQPMQVNNTTILPDQIINGTPSTLIQSLQRTHLIPPDGDLVLDVPESSARYNEPGISRLFLARGTSYTNLVIGATVTPQYSIDGIGACGLILRNADDEHYLVAYIDSDGGYGLSWRNGNSFEPGIYGEDETLQTGSHSLIVTAYGDTLYYYINNQLVGSLENEAVAGEIGNAVVNFDPVDTTCQFTDTWVWRWED